MLSRLRLSRRASILVKSYIKGSDFPPLPDLTISRQLELTAHRFPDQLAVASLAQEKYLTYQQLFEKAQTIAANLLDAGIQRGDRIVAFLPQCVEYYLVQLACALTDTILVSLNASASPAELNERLNICRATVLITSDFDDSIGLLQKVQALRESQQRLPSDQQIRNVINNIKQVYVFGLRKPPADRVFTSFERTLLGRDPTIRSVNTVKSIIQFQNPRSTTLVSYTSGTTGRSKGVALSHINIMNNAFNFATEIGITKQDRLLQTVPLYTTFGMCMGNLAALATGATVYYPGYQKDPERIIQAVNKFEPTFIIGAAMTYLSLIENIKEAGPMRSIPRGVLGGSIVTERLINDIKKTLGIRALTVCYGMTETSSVCFMTRLHDKQERKLRSVGTILDHLEAKVADEEGVTVAVGTVGELMVRGYSVFNVYYNNQEATQQNLVNGWVKSGDLAMMDSDGYVRIIGHKKNIITRAGENIYSEDIEQVLADFPGLASVHAVGVPDDMMGEEVALFYVAAPGETQVDLKELAKRLKGSLRKYQLPKYLVRVEEVPRTFNGKLQTFRLVDHFREQAKAPQFLDSIKISYEETG